MTVAEALREINKANSRLFRLQKGQFEGQTPASKVLQNNIKKLGLELTQKGYISTKGLSHQKLQGLGRQAQIFNNSLTASTRGAIRDIRNRISSWQKKSVKIKAGDLTKENAQKIWKIFDSESYKKLSETLGSDGVVNAVIRRQNAPTEDDEPFDAVKWIEGMYKSYMEGEITQEELLFGDLPDENNNEVIKKIDED